MQLPEHKRDYLLKYQQRLDQRGFLIDIMTKVGERPIFLLYPSEAITESRRTVKIDLLNPPEDKVFVQSAVDDNSSELDKKLHAEQVDIILPEDNIFALMFHYRNFKALSEEKQEEANKILIDLYGKNNDAMFKHYTSPKYNAIRFNKYTLQDGDVFLASVVGTDQSVLVYAHDIDRENHTFLITYLDNGIDRVFGETDTFDITPAEVPNLKEDKAVTTVGRFLLNRLLLLNCFGDKIAYRNDILDLGDIEKDIAKGLIEKRFDVGQYKAYVNNLYFIGHFTELCVPTYSRKSLTTDPNVEKVKAELMAKYQGRLNEPEVIQEIESTLIAMDKNYLKDDSAMRFYAPLGAKPFNISRKKMYLTVGGVETFSKHAGGFTFISNSLAEGLTPESMPAMANETRRGSFNRGDQTKLGGALTKKVIRIFQDLAISIPDCETTRGLEVDFSKFAIKRYIGSYVRKDNSPWTLLTEENKGEYNGQVCQVRSPMFCKAPHGLCAKCMGEVYANRDSNYLALEAVDITSRFTTDALKAMHGTKLAMMEIKDLNQFIIK